MSTITIKTVFLGPARDYAGTDAADLLAPPGTTVGAFRAVLVDRFDGLQDRIEFIRMAVNAEFARDDVVLEDGDEVALIPPVSGGTAQGAATPPGIWVDLVTGPIEVEKVREAATGDSELGGIVTFEGVTRADSDDSRGAVIRLDYEAYDAMARRQLERMATEAKDRFSAGRVVIIHRLGSVPVGEVSVMIAVACRHRTEAFDACRWLIDELKKDAAIWKKDVFADGSVRWTEPPREHQPQNGE